MWVKRHKNAWKITNSMQANLRKYFIKTKIAKVIWIKKGKIWTCIIKAKK